MKALTALLAGIVFGTGLLISGMTNPANVLAFLDVFGDWQPQLAFVMGGAILVAAPAFWLARRRQRTLRDEPITLPARSGIDSKLVAGGAVFGVGWGMSGICPGPGIVLLATGDPLVFAFVGTLLVGGWAATPRLPKAVASTQPTGA